MNTTSVDFIEFGSKHEKTSMVLGVSRNIRLFDFERGVGGEPVLWFLRRPRKQTDTTASNMMLLLLLAVVQIDTFKRL